MCTNLLRRRVLVGAEICYWKRTFELFLQGWQSWKLQQDFSNSYVFALLWHCRTCLDCKSEMIRCKRALREYELSSLVKIYSQKTTCGGIGVNLLNNCDVMPFLQNWRQLRAVSLPQSQEQVLVFRQSLCLFRVKWIEPRVPVPGMEGLWLTLGMDKTRTRSFSSGSGRQGLRSRGWDRKHVEITSRFLTETQGSGISMICWIDTWL